MILKGSQRTGAANLSAHLMNERDNDHVEVLELRGFVADDLHGALREAHAVSKATQCKQFMFSLSMNPPKEHIASEQDFIDAADRAEAKLGLIGQPRAIIIHEKEGRRHAHVVWSRIDGAELKAINLPYFKRKLTDLSRDLYLDHGWQLPEGLRGFGGKNPLNFTLDEWQQAKRMDIDPREIKQVFHEAWERSDTVKALGNALGERGYYLAKGDRRGFVALDVHGQVYAFSKWAGVRAKDIKARIGSPDHLPSVTELRADLRPRVTSQLKGFIDDVKNKHARDAAPLLQEKSAMVASHRIERKHLKTQQDIRWQKESQSRSDRYRKGVKGLLDRFTGRAKSIRNANEVDAYQGIMRDSSQRHDLVKAQMGDRQGLQKRFDHLRSKQKQDRKLLARDVAQYLRKTEHRSKTHTHTRKRDRNHGPDLTR